METSQVHPAPVFSPDAELRDALAEWATAIDALSEHKARSVGSGNPELAPHLFLMHRITSARMRCELLIKFNPRSAFKPAMALAA